MSKYTCVLFCLFISINVLLSQPVNQEIGNVVMPPPSAASIGKFGEIPVSYYTGVPSISIPIYTLQEGPLSLPISLNYHASGVRVAEPASWVGLGWALNAGGMISRTVMGLADERAGTGYYDIGSTLDIDQCDENDDFNTASDVDDIANGSLDGEPDIFSFSLPGYSGKFYIGSDHEPVLIPLQDLTISYVLGNQSSVFAFESFTITTPDGTNYVFGTIGDGNQAIEQLGPEGVSTVYGSVWHLKKIESHDRIYQILFKYLDENYTYKSPGFSNSAGGGAGDYDLHARGKQLDQIITNFEVVTFVGSSGNREDLGDPNAFPQYSKALSEIKIEPKTGNKYCKSFQLSHNYFEDTSPQATGGPEDKRLRLISVQEESCGTQTITNAPYTFHYIGDPETGTPFLPNRLSESIDHWGFYNGADNSNSNLNIPSINNTLTVNGYNGANIQPGPNQGGYNPPGSPSTVVFPYSGGGSADRETHIAYMALGTLDKIFYPTGGFSAFDYEANSYYETDYKDETYVEQYLATLTNQCYNTNNDCCTTVPADIESSGSFDIPNSATLDELYIHAEYTPIIPGTCETAVIVTLRRTDVVPNQDVDQASFNSSTSEDIVGKLTDFFDENTIVFGGTYKLVFLNSDNVIADARFRVFDGAIFSTPIGNRDVGGLRIQQIRIHDGIDESNDIIKTYHYEDLLDNTKSSGILYNEPVYSYAQAYPLSSSSTSGCPLRLSGNIGFYHFFFENSVLPLSSFEGYHIGYRYVVEDHNGNGSKEIEHFTEFSAQAPFDNDPHDEFDSNGGQGDPYPIAPPQPRIEAGNVFSITLKDEAGQILSQQTNYPKVGNPGDIDEYNFSTENILKGSFVGGTLYFNGYQIRNRVFRMESTIASMDNVVTETAYEYDATDRFLFPTAIEVTNSDDKVYRTEMTYPHDGGAAVYAGMVARNMIATPIETVKKVDGVQVAGNRINCSFFSTNATIGQPESSNGSTFRPIYPHTFERYEISWDENGSLIVMDDDQDGWDLETTINSYWVEDGKPYSVQTDGWSDPEMLVWDKDLITQRSYKDFVWRYAYYPNTRLVSKITDIDGQYVDYDYDDLMRLTSASARLGNVVTRYTYQFRDGSNPRSWIEQGIHYGGSFTNSDLKLRKTRQYFDGLGRLVQTNERGYSPDQKDLIVFQEYDNQGRVNKVYEPYEAADSSGNYLHQIPGSLAFTQTTFEASPLNRPATVTPPDWYATSTSYGANETALMTSYSYEYPAYTLQKEVMTDPDGHTVTTYKDRLGRVISTQASKTGQGNSANTFYQYDDKDRVRSVYPPDAFAGFGHLGYHYLYDGRDNVLMKDLPDKKLIQYFYDERDLPTFMQHGILEEQGRWVHSKYDDYGRLTETGFYNGSVSDGNTAVNFTEQLSYTSYDGDGLNPVFVGRVDAQMTKILGTTSDMLFTYFQYDPYGRVEQTRGNNHLDLTNDFAEIMDYNYDFADNLLSESRIHEAFGGNHEIDQQWLFDHSGRNTGHFFQLGNFDQIQLSEQEYTIKDQLAIKKIGKNTGGSYLQTLNYSYLENGFLEKINTPDLVGTGSASTDLFHLELRYDSNIDLGDSQKNGNIGQIIWQVKGQKANSYGFSYDFLNRIASSTYRQYNSSGQIDATTERYSTDYEYDLRGNFSTINRKGVYWENGTEQIGIIDALTFSYFGGTNYLNSVSDTAPVANAKKLGFYPGDESGVYTYDKSGNVKLDPYKELGMVYNYLNLPATVTHNSNGGMLVWTYDAAGNKLRKTSTTDVLTLNSDIASGNYQGREIEASGAVISGGTVEMEAKESILLNPGFSVEAGSNFEASIAPVNDLVKDYCGNIEYRNGVLEAIYFEEGRVYLAGGSPRYEYTLTDHLGNNRLTFADLNENGQVNESEILQRQDYYPFGLKHDGAGVEHPDRENLYQYNGKELNEDLGLNWLDYGARWYDPSIGRWNAVDPLAEDYQSWSPYNYAVNNPISFIDPDGRSAVPTIDEENKTITVNATLNFYGSGATDDRATDIAASIQADWNASGGTVEINGETYSVQFNVTGKKISKLGAALGKVFGGAKNNYINLTEGDGISETSVLGGNTGDWVWKQGGIDGKEYSHEFGHLLGWYDKSQFTVKEYGSHDYVGYSSPNIPGGGNAPGIMTPSNASQNSTNAGSNFSSLYYDRGNMVTWTRAVTSRDVGRIGINPNAPTTPITTRNLRNHPRYVTPNGNSLIRYITSQSR